MRVADVPAILVPRSTPPDTESVRTPTATGSSMFFLRSTRVRILTLFRVNRLPDSTWDWRLSRGRATAKRAARDSDREQPPGGAICRRTSQQDDA